MNVFKVCLFLLMTFALRGEIPFEEMKGLHGKMKPEAEIFSPIYGFLALKTGALERIRFYGNYGKIYKTRKETKEILGRKQELIVDPAELVVPEHETFANSVHPTWIHPAFRIRDIELLSQKNIPMDEINVEIARNFDRQFEYPLDAISALVQWLFPSIDGANFVANDRMGDPVGFLGNNPMSFAKLLKFIYECILTPPNPEKFKAQVLKIIDNDLLVPGNSAESSKRIINIKGDIRRFSEILYNALFQDGTFGKKKSKDGPLVYNNDPIYPRHIALHAVLGYLWTIANAKEQIISVMSQAGLMGFLKPKAFAHRLDIAKELDVEKALLVNARYTRQEYDRLKQKMIQHPQDPISFEESTFAGYGYEVYEQAYPPELRYGSALDHVTNSEYSDCGETALRNFFNIIVAKPGGGNNLAFLDEAQEKVSYGETVLGNRFANLKNFYTKYTNIIQQSGRDANNLWSKEVVSYLNKEPIVRKNTDVRYNNVGTNIKSVPLGMGNVLNIFAKITGDNVLGKEWTRKYTPEEIKGDPELKDKEIPLNFDYLDEHSREAFYTQIASKLDRLCEIFSREGFNLTWAMNGVKKTTSQHWDFDFFISGQKIFTFSVRQGHFVLRIQTQVENDWRQSAFDEEYLKKNTELLLAFYKKYHSSNDTLSSFINPRMILERELNHTWETLYAKNNKQASITIPLRQIYKLYGNQVEDEATQIKILESFHTLDARENTPITSLIIDMKKSLFLNKLEKKDPDRSKLFAFELGLTKDLILEDIIYHRWFKNVKSVNQKDSQGKTLLHYAAERYHLKIVKFLLEKDADVNVEMDDVPLIGDIIDNRSLDINSKIKIMKLLLNNGAKPRDYTSRHQREKRSIISHVVDFSQTYGNQNEIIKLVTLLVDHGADVNANIIYNNVSIPLISHIIDNSSLEIDKKIEIVKILLSKGSNPNILGMRHGQKIPLLHQIISQDNFTDEDKIKLIQICLDHKANIHVLTDLKETVLHSAAQYAKKTGLMEFLINQDPEMINNPGHDGRTPLYEAALFHPIEISRVFVDFLIKHGANIEYINQDGDTLLARCVARNEATCVEVLLEKDAKMNVLYNGQTLLEVANKNLNENFGGSYKERAQRILELLNQYKEKSAPKIQKVVR